MCTDTIEASLAYETCESVYLFPEHDTQRFSSMGFLIFFLFLLAKLDKLLQYLKTQMTKFSCYEKLTAKLVKGVIIARIIIFDPNSKRSQHNLSQT